MAVHQVRQLPVIPGFSVHDTGTHYIAERLEDLSDYQLLYGCRDSVTADTVAELDMLCLAERVKGELVARAEAAVTA